MPHMPTLPENKQVNIDSNRFCEWTILGLKYIDPYNTIAQFHFHCLRAIVSFPLTRLSEEQ